MTYSDETLSAYLDGELSGEKADALRRALEREPALKARLDALSAADETVRRAYASIDDAPMPARLLRLLGVEKETTGGSRGADVTPSPARKPLRRAPVWSLPLAASVALLAGVGLGAALFTEGPGEGAVRFAGVIGASDSLYAALETGRSGVAATVGGAQVTPLLTFRTADGGYCREFVSRDDSAGMRSVACREGSAWRVKIAVADAPLASGAYYAPAAGANAAIAVFVDDAIAGEPLNRDDEARLLENGWKS
ncbi:MAG: anti-sigma factor family protein [Parvularculaceae bacterium]